MWKALALITWGILGLTISLHTFQKGDLSLAEINHFINGDKTFYQVFIEPRKPELIPSQEKSYTQIESYESKTSTCQRLNDSRAFVGRYITGIIDLGSPFVEELKKVTLLKDYSDTLETTFYVHVEPNIDKNFLTFHHTPLTSDNSCAGPLKIMSDIVFIIASASSREEIKKLSRYVIGGDSLPFENEHVFVAHPFVFYFLEDKFIDFKYKSLTDSNYADHYLSDS